MAVFDAISLGKRKSFPSSMDKGYASKFFLWSLLAFPDGALESLDALDASGVYGRGAGKRRHTGAESLPKCPLEQ